MTKDEAIAKVLETALTGLQKTGEFVVEQAPDLVRQLILWNTAKYAALLVLGLLLLIVLGTISYKIAKAGTKSNAYDKDGYWIASSLTGLAGLMSGVPLTITNGLGLLKITLAPKVWLLEYAASLVRGAT